MNGRRRGDIPVTVARRPVLGPGVSLCGRNIPQYGVLSMMSENRRFHFECGETAATIICEEDALRLVEEGIISARSKIQGKIAAVPTFRTSFSPMIPSDDDEDIVASMCMASLAADVGPMASVAGAVGRYAVEHAISLGCGDVIIDNGGDITLRTSGKTRVGIHTGDPDLGDLVLEVPPHDGIYGVCSSSGRVGHSYSEGMCDVCTVLSPDPVLADACATALGNMIREAADVGPSTEEICAVEGVDGCIAICDGTVSVCGDIPQICRGKGVETHIARSLFLA